MGAVWAQMVNESFPAFYDALLLARL